MLEFYEIAELEKKWEEYDKKRKHFSFLKNKPNKISFKFDKTIVGLLLVISVAMGGIVWLITADKKDEISMADINKNIVALDKASKNVNEIVYNKSDYNITKPIVSSAVEESTRLSLGLNDIGIKSSEDAGGFIINNDYSNNKDTYSAGIDGKNLFSSIPKDEIIDFGNSPIPPKSNLSYTSKTGGQKSQSNKIIIKTSTLNQDQSSLEEKFYSTNNIMYALMLAEKSYNKGDYDNAIKWALVANEIDKDSVKSWIIFAKANYKKGRTNDALYSLETFNSRLPNKEVESVIKQIKSGAL